MIRLLRTFGASLILLVTVAQAAPFTGKTAPDAISRDILKAPLIRVHEGAPRDGDPTPAIHRNFPRII
jgi:hypothetical protein